MWNLYQNNENYIVKYNEVSLKLYNADVCIGVEIAGCRNVDALQLFSMRTQFSAFLDLDVLSEYRRYTAALVYRDCTICHENNTIVAWDMSREIFWHAS